MIGGSLLASGLIDQLIRIAASNGGGSFLFQGVDLTAVTGYLVGNHGNSSTDDIYTVNIHGCKLNATPPAFVLETHFNIGNQYLITNTSHDSDAAEYQYFYQDYYGTAEDQDTAGVQRAESTAFTNGERVSLKVSTTANVNQMNPFSFDLPSTFVALSSTTTDNIRLHLTSITALTDTNCWVDLYYPDGTTKQLYNLVSSRNVNAIGAGTALETDDTSPNTWYSAGTTDLAVGTEYKIDLDTSGDAGADGVPMIRFNLGVASAVVYVDTTYDLS